MINVNKTADYYPVSCSCMIIARDAENTIGNTLESAISAALFDDIIIILDTRTRDNTRTVLDEYERRGLVKVIPYIWKRNDFAAARNQALKFCRSAYGFWLDADDILVDGAGLKALLIAPGGAAYHLWVISPVVGGGYSIIHQLRVFPMVPGIKWELPVHEQIAYSLQRLGVQEIVTPYRVYHTGYKSSKERITQHHSNYAAIMQKWLILNRRETPERAYLSQQYQKSRQYLRGVKR